MWSRLGSSVVGLCWTCNTLDSSVKGNGRGALLNLQYLGFFSKGEGSGGIAELAIPWILQ